MLDLWNVENVELRLDGMRIFDTLLSSPHQLFIDNLIGQYLGKKIVQVQTWKNSENLLVAVRYTVH